MNALTRPTHKAWTNQGKSQIPMDLANVEYVNRIGKIKFKFHHCTHRQSRRLAYWWPRANGPNSCFKEACSKHYASWCGTAMGVVDFRMLTKSAQQGTATSQCIYARIPEAVLIYEG